jgi:hypothetical protein
MKISDLLRTLADQLENTNLAQLEAPESDLGVFVSPLQQELELKKKEQGVENIFDEPDHSADDSKEDDLIAIKRNAGIR